MSSDDLDAESPVVIEVESFLQKIDLTDVRTAKFSGELVSEHLTRPDLVSFDVQGGYRFEEAELLCRFDYRVSIRNKHEEDIANIEVSLVAVFSTDISNEPSREAMNHFMANYGFFVVAPFMREAVHTMSARLHLGPINIGLFRRGSDKPVGFYVRQVILEDEEPAEEDSSPSDEFR